MFEWGLNSGDLFNRFLDSLTTPFQDWLSQYPVLLWLATHPLWLLAAVLVVLFLLSGLLRAVAGLTEKLWLVLLSLPVNLMRWLWQGMVFLLSRPFASKPVVEAGFVNPPVLNPQDRLTEVLNRLEALRQEQDELLKEVKSLLAARNNGQT